MSKNYSMDELAKRLGSFLDQVPEDQPADPLALRAWDLVLHAQATGVRLHEDWANEAHASWEAARARAASGMAGAATR